MTIDDIDDQFFASFLSASVHPILTLQPHITYRHLLIIDLTLPCRFRQKGKTYVYPTLNSLYFLPYLQHGSNTEATREVGLKAKSKL